LADEGHQHETVEDRYARDRDEPHTSAHRERHSAKQKRQDSTGDCERDASENQHGEPH
jgi:hypothetical protein